VDQFGLTIEAVYDDADLVELRVVARNRQFSGGTSVYVAIGDLGDAADALSGFPASVSDHRRVKWGDFRTGSGLGGTSLQFQCVNATGSAGVWIEVTSGDVDPGPRGQTTRLFLKVEAAGIDRFVEALRAVGQAKRGIAYLESVG
jgi:hypothetical protein